MVRLVPANNGQRLVGGGPFAPTGGHDADATSGASDAGVRRCRCNF